MPQRHGEKIVETKVEARQGVTGHHVRYVLGYGLVAIVVAFSIVYALFAESEAKRPVIPTEGGHPIRSKAATDSDRRRPPC